MSPHAAGAGARIVAEELACGYAPGRAVVEASIEAAGGAPCVVAGRSGSGRSTLAQALAGFVPRLTGGWRRGRVALWHGDAALDLAAATPAAWLARVAWYGAPPRANLSGTRRSVHGELALALELRGDAPGDARRRCASVLAAIGLEALADRDPRSLSDGETARLALGAVLVAGPDAVVLDDPEAYVDGAGLRELLGLAAGEDGRERAVVACTGRPAALAEAAPRWFGSARAVVLGGGAAQEGRATDVLGAPGVLAHGVLPCWAGPADAAIAAAAPAASGDLVADAAWAALAPEADGCRVVADGVAVAFGSVAALRGAGLCAEPGTVTALVGANGGGKTTLLRVLSGLVAPLAGEVRVGGRAPSALARRDAARLVGLSGSRPEDAFVARTVRADLALGPRWAGLTRRAGEAAVAAALDAAGLAGAADDHPHELPAAPRRWAALAAVLVLRSPVLLLDEPTVGLDGPGQLRLEAALGAWRRQGRTVVLATHDLDFAAEVADRIAVVAGGVDLAEGAPGDILADAALLARARLAAPARLAVAAALGLPAVGPGTRAALWAARARGEPEADLGAGPRYNGRLARPGRAGPEDP